MARATTSGAGATVPGPGGGRWPPRWRLRPCATQEVRAVRPVPTTHRPDHVDRPDHHPALGRPDHRAHPGGRRSRAGPHRPPPCRRPAGSPRPRASRTCSAWPPAEGPTRPTPPGPPAPGSSSSWDGAAWATRRSPTSPPRPPDRRPPRSSRPSPAPDGPLLRGRRRLGPHVPRRRDQLVAPGAAGRRPRRPGRRPGRPGARPRRVPVGGRGLPDRASSAPTSTTPGTWPPCTARPGRPPRSMTDPGRVGRRSTCSRPDGSGIACADDYVVHRPRRRDRPRLGRHGVDRSRPAPWPAAAVRATRRSSCPAPGTCAGRPRVDGVGADPGLGLVARPGSSTPTVASTRVSCPTTTFCMAADAYGDVRPPGRRHLVGPVQGGPDPGRLRR